MVTSTGLSLVVGLTSWRIVDAIQATIARYQSVSGMV
jgi:hypothetical protein